MLPELQLPEKENEEEISLPERLDPQNTDATGSKFCVGFACAIINACNLVIISIAFLCRVYMQIDIGFDNSNDKVGISDHDTFNTPKENNGKVDAIYEAFQDFPPLAAPITVIIIVFLGCRITAVAGGIMIAAGFLIASFVDDHVLIGISLAGVAGLGISFLQLSSIITLLENFEKKRLRAIILYNLLAEILIIAVMVTFMFDRPVTFMFTRPEDWRVLFRWQCVPASVAILASFFLGRSAYDQTKYRQLFHRCSLYMILLIMFFDTFGRSIPESYLKNLLDDALEIEENLLELCPSVAKLLGLLLLFCWKKKGFAAVMLIIGISQLIVGVSSCITPSAVVLPWLLIYSIFIGFNKSIVKPLLDKSVPNMYGKEAIKVVEGLLTFSNGFATLISGPINEAIEEEDDGVNGEKSHIVFYVAATVFIISGIIALTTARKVSSSNGTNSNASVDSTAIKETSV